jgi:glutaryl-CoA dehydrogenase
MERVFFKNEGRATTAQISMAKNNVDMAINIAREARQILGAMGIIGDYSIMRHMMNLESVITYEGTHDIHLITVWILPEFLLLNSIELLKYL